MFQSYVGGNNHFSISTDLPLNMIDHLTTPCSLHIYFPPILEKVQFGIREISTLADSAIKSRPVNGIFASAGHGTREDPQLLRGCKIRHVLATQTRAVANS